MNDHCTVEIVDEILGTRRLFEIPSAVAEAERNCTEVLRAKFFLKWCDPEELFSPIGDEGERLEPVAVAIIEKPHSLKVVWHAVGSQDDAVLRREEILKGIWVMGGGANYGDE